MNNFDADQFYRQLDELNLQAYMAFFADDATLRFANFPPLVGKIAIEENFRSLASTVVRGMQHQFVDRWESKGSIVLESNVTYDLFDDRVVTVPAITVLRVNSLNKVADMRVYIDASSVFGFPPSDQ